MFPVDNLCLPPVAPISTATAVLQFLLFLPLHFGMPDLVRHLPTLLLKVY